MIRRRTSINRRTARIRFTSRTKKHKPVNLKYRAWLREWPCFICFHEHCLKYGISFWEACRKPEARAMFRDERSIEVCGKTEAAHVGSKGMAQKCPEWEMMPLGRRHHRHPTDGGFPDSHHAGTRVFWDKHRLSRLNVLEFLRHLYVDETGMEI